MSLSKESQELLNSIKQTTEAQLPNIVGETLKGVLEDYEKLKKEYASLEKTKNDLSSSCSLLGKEKERLQERLASQESLEKREEALESKEVDFRVKEGIFLQKEKAVEERLKDHKEILSLVLRNTVIKKNISDNLSGPSGVENSTSIITEEEA